MRPAVRPTSLCGHQMSCTPMRPRDQPASAGRRGPAPTGRVAEILGAAQPAPPPHVALPPGPARVAGDDQSLRLASAAKVLGLAARGAGDLGEWHPSILSGED